MITRTKIAKELKKNINKIKKTMPHMLVFQEETREVEKVDKINILQEKIEVLKTEWTRQKEFLEKIYNNISSTNSNNRTLEEELKDINTALEVIE